MSEIQEEYISCEEGAVKSTIITRVQTETRKKCKFWLLFATLSALFLAAILVKNLNYRLKLLTSSFEKGGSSFE